MFHSIFRSISNFIFYSTFYFTLYSLFLFYILINIIFYVLFNIISYILFYILFCILFYILSYILSHIPSLGNPGRLDSTAILEGLDTFPKFPKYIIYVCVSVLSEGRRGRGAEGVSFFGDVGADTRFYIGDSGLGLELFSALRARVATSSSAAGAGTGSGRGSFIVDNIFVNYLWWFLCWRWRCGATSWLLHWRRGWVRGQLIRLRLIRLQRRWPPDGECFFVEL